MIQQTRISNVPPRRCLRSAEAVIDEPAPPQRLGRPFQVRQQRVVGRFATKKKPHQLYRDPQKYIPHRPLIETLIGGLEATKIRKTIDSYGGNRT